MQTPLFALQLHKNDSWETFLPLPGMRLFECIQPVLLISIATVITALISA